MIKNNKGVALATLVVAIIVMLTIVGTIVYTSTDTIKLRKLDDMYNDIRLLEQKVSNYYLENNDIPVLDKIDIENPDLINIETKNPNDKENYYIIDLEKLGVFTLKYGKDYKEYASNNAKNDVYIINEASHTIYYVKGIEINDKTYNSLQKEYEEIDGVGVLPREYKRVEYIKSTGTQYIDTGIAPNENTAVEIIADYTDLTSACLIGSRTEINQNAFGILVVSTGTTRYDYGTNTYNVGILEDKNTYKLNKNELYLNGESVNSFSNATINSTYNLTMFSLNTAGTQGSFATNGKIYSCKIWKNDKLERDFVPCYSKSSGRAGMYDLVHDVFYDSETTDNFVVPLLPSKYQQVEYIESTGTQYIDTGIVPGSKTKQEVGISFNDLSANQYMGWGSSGSQESFYLGIAASKFRISVSTAYAYKVSTKTVDTSKHVFYLESGKQMVDDEIIGNDVIGDTAVNGQTIYMFAQHQEWVGGAGNYMWARIYYCKIWDEGELVRDFVPCYRKSDNEIGMYDLVTDEFYENDGTGTFIAGNNV